MLINEGDQLLAKDESLWAGCQKACQRPDEFLVKQKRIQFEEKGPVAQLDRAPAF